MIEAALIKQLGYEFNDERLFEVALTHRSVGKNNNERLEFLGDAILGFLIADVLFEIRPMASEGELTRLRARLVRKETLAAIANELHLGDYLRLGGGEMKSGGYRRESILADAMEAIIGAVYLDGGVKACRLLVDRLYMNQLDQLPSLEALKDSKTRLQEWLQAKKMAVPLYEVIAMDGPPHKQRITVACQIPELDIRVEVIGESRRKAEQAAAESVLMKLSEASDG